MSEIKEMRDRIRDAKQLLEDLWTIKQITDQKFLEASDRLDSMINEYNRLLKQASRE